MLGMWISSIILAPVAVYLTYKATNDSALLDVDWYVGKYKHYKEMFMARLPKKWLDKINNRKKKR